MKVNYIKINGKNFPLLIAMGHYSKDKIADITFPTNQWMQISIIDQNIDMIFDLKDVQLLTYRNKMGKTYFFSGPELVRFAERGLEVQNAICFLKSIERCKHAQCGIGIEDP